MNCRRPLGFGLSALSAGAVFGATLQLDRSVVSAGGGAATTPRFSITGSIGQPVANSATSTAGSLVGRSGFWSQVVRWVNAPPTPTADTVGRRAGQGAHVLASQLLANDLDGDWDALQFVSVDTASAGGGTVLQDGPWIVYLPPAGGNPLADDSFSYRVTDGLGTSVAGTVMVQVTVPPATAGGPLQILSLPGAPAQVEVRFQGIAGRSYRIETGTAVNGPWTGAGVIVADAFGRLSFIESVALEPRFYRILEP